MNMNMNQTHTLFIAIVAVIAVFSLSLFSFPNAFVFFFNDILGNVLLVLVVLGIFMWDPRWAIGIASIFIVLYQAFHLSQKQLQGEREESGKVGKEGFSWSDTQIENFKQFQKTFNPDITFDIQTVQRQATPEEVDYLLTNNKWPWSDAVQTMYKEAVMTDSFIRMDAGTALNTAQTIYNETAIKEILSWNSKEGTFILFGATVGHTKGLPDNVNNVIRCAGSKGMEKVIHQGYASIHGDMIDNTTAVENSDIPSVVPGFQFLKEACNPCGALNDIPDYSCPFSINVGSGPDVSSIWKDLWGL